MYEMGGPYVGFSGNGCINGCCVNRHVSVVVDREGGGSEGGDIEVGASSLLYVAYL